ncbi:MAG: FKBP-type peptidyl-prolyl cis-trans isomerase [Candidatus Njordarchaeales archaeon]
MSSKKVLPGSYVKLSFEAKTEDGEITESTKRRVQRDEEFEDVDMPIIIKIGEKEVFFEDFLLNLEEGKEYDIEVPPEKAYGVRDPKKIETIPLKRLRSLTGEKRFSIGQILYDANGQYYGRIIYIGSRDVTIDRNHPYAGKKIIVHLKIHKVVLPSDPEDERLKVILERYLGEELLEKINAESKDKEVEIEFPASVLMSEDFRRLLRTVYVVRKAIAEEIMRELNFDRVRFIDTFSIRETPKVETPSIVPSQPITEETVSEEKREEEIAEKTEEKSA